MAKGMRVTRLIKKRAKKTSKEKKSDKESKSKKIEIHPKITKQRSN